MDSNRIPADTMSQRQRKGALSRHPHRNIRAMALYRTPSLAAAAIRFRVSNPELTTHMHKEKSPGRPNG